MHYDSTALFIITINQAWSYLILYIIIDGKRKKFPIEGNFFNQII
jgi:hypothetical protein